MPTFFPLKSALILAACLGLCVTAGAQSTPAAATSAAPAASEAKSALARKMVAAQNGPEMDRMVYQLTATAMQPLIAKWTPTMESLPADKFDKAREQLNAELQKSSEVTRKIIETQMPKSGDGALVQAYLDRFSEDELKALVAIFEAGVFKKYQSLAPELGNAWIKDVIDKTRDSVLAEGKRFDEAATKIVGKPAEAPKADAPKAEAKKPDDKKAEDKKADPKSKATKK